MKRSIAVRGMKTMIMCFVLCFVFADWAPAQNKADEIEKLLQIYYDYGQFNGTVLVAEGGKVIFKKGYGLANMEWNIHNEPDTKFRIGSITKQFTSMLVMQLVEEGKIKLDGKLTDYLPDYRKDTGDKITIHHLLSNTSGVPNFTNFPDFFKNVSRNSYPVDEFLTKFCSKDLEFEPGSKFAYTNSGYYILGAVIEQVTGKTYEQVLKEKISDPLKIANIGYDHFNVIIKNRADGYIKSFDGYTNAAYLDMSIPFAGGSLYSTVEDLYIWDQALYENTLLSEKYKHIMFTPVHNNYAYGWGIRKMVLSGSQDSVNTITHDGGINGFTTKICRFVDDKHLIVLFNNTGNTNLNAMNLGIANILYGKAYDNPKKSLAQELYKEIMESDVESAIKLYHNLKEKHPDDYVFDERELNQLGYRLLNDNNTDAAIKVFELNANLSPASFNVYDSLAEAFMKKGEKEKAVINYAKSLELNPNNRNAIEMLHKMTDN